jgi:hypothetical protein
MQLEGYYLVQKSLPLVPIPNQINEVHDLRTGLFKFSFSIII